MGTEVHKFGGTSVGDAERIARCAELVDQAADKAQVVVVASAMGGTTDALLEAADAASRGDLKKALEIRSDLQNRHLDALAVLGDAGPSEALEELLSDLERRLRGIAALSELSPRSRDGVLAIGEKLSVRLLAFALQQRSRNARAVDADLFLETDGVHGRATPLHGVAERGVASALEPDLAEGLIPVVTGFCGHGPDGGTTTFGRGGSDYSATFVAAAVNADEVVIWTDVDGVYSADPGVVPEARPVPQLNFREAGELSYYGAKVLHQRTIIPVARRGIPIRIRSTLEPDKPGTVVDGRFTRGSHPVKAVSSVAGQVLVSVEGKGMAGVPGIARRVFGALARESINVTMISQSSSESSICLAVPEPEATAAEVALKRAFRADLSRGDVEEIVVQRSVALVAAVGLGMAHTPGVAAQVCSALAGRSINILAIAQGSSELNISLAVASQDAEDAVRAIHHTFGLHRLDPGEDTTHRLDLIVVGFGAIGRSLVKLVGTRSDHVRARFGLEMRVVAVCDRTGYLFSPRGLDPKALDRATTAKTEGKGLADVEDSVPGGDATRMLRAATRYRLARPVLVDTSDGDSNHELFLAAFDLGLDVVTANKKPLAGSMASWRAMEDATRRTGRRLKAEATVGAGLPVVDTVETLRATGDVLHRIEGCLSGTLAFVFGELERDRPLSEIVVEARDAGYTEPDAALDLTGRDVLRKALILGRMAGLLNTDIETTPVGLVPDDLVGVPFERLLEGLQARDDEMADTVKRAREAGCALRYVARVEAGAVTVGPERVPADGSLGRLQGTDNMLVFTSERYAARPLVVTGPGAGIDVTAMAVLGDVLRVAAERAGVSAGGEA